MAISVPIDAPIKPNDGISITPNRSLQTTPIASEATISLRFFNDINRYLCCVVMQRNGNARISI